MAVSEPRCVLITRFSALGDVAMTLPVVYDVCRANPDTRFIVLTRPLPAKLFINAPENLTVEAIDLNRYRGLRGLMRLCSEIRAKFPETDTVADLHDVIRTKVIRTWFRLHGARSYHINKGRLGRRALTRRRNKVLLPLPTMRSRYCEVFYRAGLRHAERFRNLFAHTPADPALYAAATPPKQPVERWIAIAPFARHAGKIYPADQMEQVVATLSSRPDHRIFLLGAGSEETNILGRWAMKYDRTVNMAMLSLGLEAELALLHACDALVSMDSANMHMASLVGLRTISVWGATHPYCGFMGWRQQKADAVQLDMVCRPCSVFGNKPCFRGDYHCLRGIPPSFILERLDATP